MTFAGDPKGVAPDLQAFFKGLGTNGELWSGVMTQYCQGIAAGAQTCPASAQHVGYPTGGALAGVWADESVAAPRQATFNQLAAEATKAATHFGNKTTAANRNLQYFIVSPTGTHPDGFNTASGNFCAWHDATTSTTDHIAFTNMPYVTDAGASCGVGFVNAGAAGALDGVTIVGGHEYAETITDQFPAGGWTDSVGNENADKCAWIRSGQGASQDITLATGTFAVQSTWANDFNGGTGGCEVSHPIVTNTTGNVVSVTNPGSQTSTVGTAVSLQIQATDSGGATLSYAATGLPAGLGINAATGLISGTTTATGSSSVVVTASDGTGANGSASFTWTVNPVAGNIVTVTNPGAQTTTVGTAVSLQIQATDSGGATLSYARDGPAGRSQHQRRDRTDHRHPDDGRVLVRRGDGERRHGRPRQRLVRLDDQPGRRWLHAEADARQRRLRDRHRGPVDLVRRCRHGDAASPSRRTPGTGTRTSAAMAWRPPTSSSRS